MGQDVTSGFGLMVKAGFIRTYGFKKGRVFLFAQQSEGIICNKKPAGRRGFNFTKISKKKFMANIHQPVTINQNSRARCSLFLRMYK